MTISKNTERVAKGGALALGLLLTVLMAAMLLAAKPAHADATFTVNSTGDKNDLDFPGGVFDGSSDGECFTGDVLQSGNECTLRAAIQEANVTPGADVIEFGIPGAGPHTIAPATELPRITDPVTINGYSESGASPNTLATGNNAVLKIELDGASPGHGFVITAANSTVKGLVINRTGEGIRIVGSGATGNKIIGNFIGTDASGTQNLGNSDTGVAISDAPNNAIGGTTAAARNIISGNGGGVGIQGAEATRNEVVGNYIGTDRNGTAPLSNSGSGVHIEQGASGNTVGGTQAGARNVISGNDVDGVRIEGNGATGNEVVGNYVGTDMNGAADLGNLRKGVHIREAPNNIIGGSQTGERNVISGNDDEGVRIFGISATGNEVMGNYLGTDKSGIADLGNDSSGVYIDRAPGNTVGGTTVGERNVISGNDEWGVEIFGGGAATGNNAVMGNYIGADRNGTAPLGNSLEGVRVNSSSDNTIGGTQAGARNVITANDREGVSIEGKGTGNRILSNSIFSNGELGIDLVGNGGPTPNDPDDPDTGPNHLQNFPVITSASTSANRTIIKGTLDSVLNTTFTIQFFSSPAPDPSGFGEGQTLVGETTVTTDTNGDASFEFDTAAPIRAGQVVSATATNIATGDTSEFSSAVKVGGPPVAKNDSYGGVEDRVLRVPARGVLRNDTDPDDDALTASVVTRPKKGTLSLSPHGGFTYKPARNFAGTVSFVYRVSDGRSGIDTATVNIKIRARPG